MCLRLRRFHTFSYIFSCFTRGQRYSPSGVGKGKGKGKGGMGNQMYGNPMGGMGGPDPQFAVVRWTTQRVVIRWQIDSEGGQGGQNHPKGWCWENASVLVCLALRDMMTLGVCSWLSI